jgi:hypothetical protein
MQTASTEVPKVRSDVNPFNMVQILDRLGRIVRGAGEMTVTIANAAQEWSGYQ